jgi:hypothetical protein
MGNCTNSPLDLHKQVELYDMDRSDHQITETNYVGENKYAWFNRLNILARFSQNKKESTGIYDYEADGYEEKNFTCKSTIGRTETTNAGYLVMNKNNEVMIATKKIPSSNKEIKPLLSFAKLNSGSYRLMAENNIKSELGMWLIIKTQESVR